MEVGEAVIGMRVRYPRTGTSGTIVALTFEGGDSFAELDSTHLLYRIDQLIPAGSVTEKKSGLIKDTIEQVKKEREFYSLTGYQDAISPHGPKLRGGWLIAQGDGRQLHGLHPFLGHQSFGKCL